MAGSTLHLLWLQGAATAHNTGIGPQRVAKNNIDSIAYRQNAHL
jgi:hypothetical protein